MIRSKKNLIRNALERVESSLVSTPMPSYHHCYLCVVFCPSDDCFDLEASLARMYIYFALGQSFALVLDHTT